MNKPSSLVQRLMFSIVAASAVLSLAMAFSVRYFFERQMQATLDNKAQVTLDYLAGSLAVPVWNLSDDAIYQIAHTAAQDETIGMIEIMDFDRKRILYAQRKTDNQRLIHASRIIEHQGFRVGEVRIGLDTQNYDRQLGAWINSLLFVAIVVTAISALLMAFLLRRFLRAPFAELTALTNAYVAGNYASDLEIRYVEFQPFARTLLEMGRQILEQLQKLKDSNVALQQDEIALRRAMADLEHARDAAEAASRAKSTFLANTSHELRTPMNGIIGMTELALRKTNDPKLHDCLEKIGHSAHRLLGTIDDILDIAKIEAERMVLEQVDFTLAAVLANFEQQCGKLAATKGLQFTVELPADLAALPLRGDPQRLAQVLNKLVGNAIKFTERGTIVVAIRPDEDNRNDVLLRCEVRDSGIGIEAADLARLFAAFEQADGSLNRKYGGTGLGLAISKRLIQLMGGEIGASSEPGQGSVFWFTVRLAKAV